MKVLTTKKATNQTIKLAFLRNKAIWGIFSVTVFLLLWHSASVTGLFGRMPKEYAGILLPSPETVFATIVDSLRSGILLKHVGVSFWRVMSGFALAVVIGVPLGLGMAFVPTVNSIFDPIVRLFQPIPGIAWVPLAILWFGLGDKAAIFIITMGSIFPILLNTFQGVQSVNPLLISAARILGANHLQILRRVVLPSVIPYLVTGFRLGLGFGWRVMIAAEMVGVPDGLGYLLGIGRATARTDITIMTMVVIGVIMVLMEEVLFMPLERHTAAWRNGISKQ